MDDFDVDRIIENRLRPIKGGRFQIPQTPARAVEPAIKVNTIVEIIEEEQVKVDGEIQEIRGPFTFQTELEQRQMAFIQISLASKNEVIDLVLWGDNANLVKQLSTKLIVKGTGYAKKYKERFQIHLEHLTYIEQIKRPIREYENVKTVSDLTKCKNGEYIKASGTVINIHGSFITIEGLDKFDIAWDSYNKKLKYHDLIEVMGRVKLYEHKGSTKVFIQADSVTLQRKLL
ncbi:MAG: hypothetical protein NT022_02970 [Deltaproteobacteria bacterium]|nr:hypothetical protein [Deltaproteobacteria bacterium]